jgi:hypothetical protein
VAAWGVVTAPDRQHSDTLRSRAVHHVFRSSYSVREAEQVLPRLPAGPPRDEAVGQDDPRGKMHHFGPGDDPDGARKNYLAGKNALHAGGSRGRCQRMPP